MKHRAQSTLEYVVLIAVIAAALFAMQTYIKRGMQGRMRDSADNLGQGFFYSPGATNSNSQIAAASKEATTSYSKDDPSAAEYRVNVTESTLQSTRVTNRTEEVGSYAAEPQR